MSSKLPSFSFYPKDFLTDHLVLRMTRADQVGAYFLLLCAAWQEDPPASLPNDDQILSAYAKMNAVEWAEQKAVVLAPFTLDKDGRYRQKRLRKEYDKAIASAKAASDEQQRSIEDASKPSERSIRAKLAAEARWNKRKGAAGCGTDAKAMLSDAQAYAEAMPKHMQEIAKEEGGKGGGVSSSEKDNPPKSEAKQNQSPPKPPPLDGDAPATVDKPRRRRKRKTAESKPREPNPLFDAIADVCGVDPKLQGSQIGISCAKLKECEPPYTPEEVYAFGKRFHEFCSWAAKDGRARPTPTELSKWIGGLRTSPVSPPNLFDGMTPEKPTNVDHLV